MPSDSPSPFSSSARPESGLTGLSETGLTGLPETGLPARAYSTHF